MTAKVFVHESAYVDDNVEIGQGTKVWHFAHLLPGTRIGENCSIGQNVMIGPDVKVGDNCKIQNNVALYKGVELEDGVFCGPSCVFTNVLNPRSEVERKNEYRPTRVRRGATIGANATIVCGQPLAAAAHSLSLGSLVAAAGLGLSAGRSACCKSLWKSRTSCGKFPTHSFGSATRICEDPLSTPPRASTFDDRIG